MSPPWFTCLLLLMSKCEWLTAYPFRQSDKYLEFSAGKLLWIQEKFCYRICSNNFLFSTSVSFVQLCICLLSMLFLLVIIPFLHQAFVPFFFSFFCGFSHFCHAVWKLLGSEGWAVVWLTWCTLVELMPLRFMQENTKRQVERLCLDIWQGKVAWLSVLKPCYTGCPADAIPSTCSCLLMYQRHLTEKSHAIVLSNAILAFPS